MTQTRRALLGLLLLAPVAAVAQSASAIFTDRGLAMRGYDPVAYFTEGRPTRGQAAFTHQWNGATWRFATAAHRDMFAADPAKYAPQYGGFCAWAVSEGYHAPVDPNAWKIVDGKLYLNYDRRIQRQWEADVPGRIARGDANWPAVAAKIPAPLTVRISV
jgi:YHS domain-containing protein